MRKTVSIILLTAFILTMAFPAAAAGPAAKVSKDEALKIARESMQVPGDFKLNSVSYRYEPNGTQVWSFYWGSNNPNKPGDISVEVDAETGRLRSFNRYSPDNFGPAKYTMEDALAVAEEYVKTMNPAEYSQLRLEPPVVPDAGIWQGAPEREIYEKKMMSKPAPAMDYYFRWNRTVDGYMFFENGVNVGVSGSTGRIISYYFNWDNTNLPAVDSVVYLKEAKKLFNAKTGFQLGYIRSWNEGNPSPEAALGYFYPNPYYQVNIDAVTGEAIDPNGRTIDIPANSSPIAAETAAEYAGAPLSMEEAMTLAEKWASIPDGYILSNISYYENPQGISPSTWNFSWTGKKQIYINVGINADNGEVTNLDTGYYPFSSPKADITYDEAVRIAEGFLKDAAPSKANQLRVDSAYYNGEYGPDWNPGEKRPYYGVHFSRLINGLPVVDSGANVTVNGEGKVTSYWLNWEEIKFPPADDVISAEKAAGIMAGRTNVDIGYARIADGQGGWKLRLVYRFQIDGGLYVDARTGEIKNRWGPILYEKSSLKDIAGHWAEKDIQKLADLKIITSPSEHYKPDGFIPRGEVTALIVKALELNQYFPDTPTFRDVPKDDNNYGYIEALYKAGIITGDKGNFKPGDAITREELAVILAKAFNGLKTDETVTLDVVKDAASISTWARDGVLASAKAGLILGDNKGNFNPRKNVTRAEAAAIIARILEAK